MKPDFSKGLLPAVIVDDLSGDVLMVAYMDETAYQKTMETGQTWFYSRSRQELWHKGATSGNYQSVQSVFLDCDRDTLLVRVNPQGPACHTGKRSCFFYEVTGEGIKEVQKEKGKKNIFDQVITEIQNRKAFRVENSYTNYLFDKGIDKIGKKVIEEAGEVVIAAKNNNKPEVINEVSDLLYHSLVLLAEQDVPLDAVKKELDRRTNKKGNSKGDRPEIENW
ncbi:bifunctional phosphoribosyl-AMP cyclohydrolase/phosphoribosyl-ATP diphosphatase HisIE [Sediminibacillus dalangtanensis]|uniref:Histidine biosynthesis bifunctional protein HisIE n=1 Tax=Sediminibacillus dalangtanensis TaxID=2729421 RepID=A0ABX7VRJ7_9BACI|nr:bifunctional phosphoribosyl-AMP cyclohydrolase/phosphoribosyl-ATP diphosphatase HisIE [Sediminibacillus dalangtanensis]QTM99544.1 bifunctional phosphoribosyl-AMP cyclohydrolase/phosphoribosyl-ATP diphosphatase HisIE [Sediminibacillus dalangtanensis]